VKFSKVAAVMAGSVVAVGVGAPAFAADTTTAAPAMPTSINAGVDQLLAAQPAQQLLDGTHLSSAVATVDHTTDALPQQLPADQLLGQATDVVKGAALPAVTGAVPGASLLGGLPLNGLPLH
jgi:hypothetical protein